MTGRERLSKVKVRLINRSGKVELPKRQTPHSVGYDLQADHSVELLPGERQLVKTGIAIALEPGWEGQVRLRSGLAHKHGVTVLNAPGTIDADYRGEVGVILINHGNQPFFVMPGERVAQLVIVPVPFVSMEQVLELDETMRSDGGFGSTGQ
jgi:dUTP pyrophosphatase